MNIYRIINTTSGADLGLFEALTEDDAITSMLADAGCDDAPSPALAARVIKGAKTVREVEAFEALDALIARLTDGWTSYDDKRRGFIGSFRGQDGVEGFLCWANGWTALDRYTADELKGAYRILRRAIYG